MLIYDPIFKKNKYEFYQKSQIILSIYIHNGIKQMQNSIRLSRYTS